jgi:hypothetical protein
VAKPDCIQTYTAHPWICIALVHAAGPPYFSYVFSQLLGTFFIKDHQAQKAQIYSMAILGIANFDAIFGGSMHYLVVRHGSTACGYKLMNECLISPKHGLTTRRTAKQG